jgi:signal transduction histidine kinase
MPERATGETLDQYEEKAVAHYFAYDVRFPYVSVTLMSLVAAWLMWEKVPTSHIVVWLVLGSVANLLRERFARRMRSLLAQGKGYRQLVRGFTVSAFINGVTWGAFAWLYFDAHAPLTLLLVGSYLAGHVGGAVTPLSIYLPAFYAFLLPTLLPYVWLLASANTPTHYVLTGLTLLFLFSMAGYARLTNRLHRDGIRLRWENQHLIRDLELRKADAEAASRTKSLFLAGVSHDLKQPMRAIALYGAYLRHLSTSADTNAAVAHTATKIEAAVGEMQGQIARLLELSRLESGTLQLNLETVDLGKAFEQLRTMFDEQARAKGLRLQLAPPCVQPVWADRALLQSVLQNFVSNAIKNTETGAVYVGTRLRAGYPPGRRLCIEVRDSGCGVPAERLPLLFDAYRSFDDRTASESHGLGLAIAKAQATYLGCDIDVRSQPGCGSTFTLCGLRSANAGVGTMFPAQQTVTP